MQNVALVAIRIMQQRDVGAAIGVVFDCFDLGRHTILVAAKINLAVLLLVAAAAMPNRNFALVVASAGALFRFQQTLFRSLLGDMALVENGHKPPRRRIWIKALQSHLCLLPCSSLGGLHRPRFYCLTHFPTPFTNRDYKFSANSIIFSPSASFTYAFFQSRRYPSVWPRRRIFP